MFLIYIAYHLENKLIIIIIIIIFLPKVIVQERNY